MKKFLGLFFRIGVSAGLLVYLLREADPGALKEALFHYSPGWWVAGLLVYAAFQALSVQRWRYICKRYGFEKDYRYFGKLYLVNMYFNTLLPGIMGGDVVRGYYLVRDGFGLKESSLSVILDRASGLLGISFLLILALPLWGDFLPPRVRHVTLLCAGLVLGGGFVLSLRATVHRKGLFAPVAWPSFAGLFAYGLAVQILYVVQFWVLAGGLHLGLPFKDYLVIVPVTGFLASLPVSLGGLGVRETSLVYFLGLRGLPQEKGLLLGLLVYSTVLAGALPGAILYLRGVRGAGD
ncbi:lysylphosphatidylglycerol synthase transmembrane domain-containing protein [Thermosulfurimonas sp. F29]|uniref:lysylphosphatidylglycerol synthase transmembrane domain-containing protein n=1 Tax=Thermosulfurimonas sp. F29 TaxID=2867247 RepID=UPI001C83FD4A|nr:lysylphosphatidylglycerol synthase transmembrane domain-containing protein [Thermosulfurimonas sp. F29]MBX6422924.1 flippase-like domain-containing protein [Thermosulfurimonas sp. F29]